MQQLFASPQEALEHFGTKGMRWGVRNKHESKAPIIGYVKEPITRTTKNGDQFTLTPKPPKAIKVLGRIDRIGVPYNRTSSSLQITDKHGTKIGKASFTVLHKTDIHLSLIQIDKSVRGQGYATAILKAAAEHGKANGFTRLKLQVPHNTPDALHIYTKMGFKVTGESKLLGSGMTNMEYQFDEN